MRRSFRFVLVLSALALPVAAYVAYPLATAWAIREAVRSGDAAYLERKIEWASVRETLRASMTRVAFDMPDPETEPGVKPGLWKRLKAYVGGGAVNKFIDSYVTPEGLPQLFEYRKMYRQNVSGETDEKAAPILDRMKRFWARVIRAEFHSPTAFEVELADRYDASRHYVALLELRDWGWKLTKLRVRELKDMASAADGATAGDGKTRGDVPPLDSAHATAILPTDR